MNDDLQAQRVAADHARCWNLIPWWVNGTLTSDEVSGVEQHVAACSECAAELALQRALQAQLRDGDPVSIAPQSAWQKMTERLDREDEALTRGNFRGHFYARPKAARVLQWAVAAQALLIVGLTTVVWQQARAPDAAALQAAAMLQPRYETLTTAPADATLNSRDGVRVVFRRDVTVAEVSTLLHTVSAQIVAGPSEAGVYTLASPAVGDKGPSEQATVVLQRLRDDPRVVFAEPSALPAESH